MTKKTKSKKTKKIKKQNGTSGKINITINNKNVSGTSEKSKSKKHKSNKSDGSSKHKNAIYNPNGISQYHGVSGGTISNKDAKIGLTNKEEYNTNSIVNPRPSPIVNPLALMPPPTAKPTEQIIKIYKTPVKRKYNKTITNTKLDELSTKAIRESLTNMGVPIRKSDTRAKLFERYAKFLEENKQAKAKQTDSQPIIEEVDEDDDDDEEDQTKIDPNVNIRNKKSKPFIPFKVNFEDEVKDYKVKFDKKALLDEVEVFKSRPPSIFKDPNESKENGLIQIVEDSKSVPDPVPAPISIPIPTPKKPRKSKKSKKSKDKYKDPNELTENGLIESLSSDDKYASTNLSDLNDDL